MELEERFSRGERDAFEELFRQFQGEVFRWVMRIVRDRGAAEDLTVESFWRMYRAHARFEPGKPFGAWARRIATNVALDHLRKVRREMAMVNEPADAIAGRANPGLQRETRERIAAAFEALAPKLRVVARLSLLEEVTNREIAEALGISEGAVRVRLHRATRRCIPQKATAKRRRDAEAAEEVSYRGRARSGTYCVTKNARRRTRMRFENGNRSQPD